MVGVGGDVNVHVKRTLRRTNLLGRNAPAAMHVDVLYTRYVARKPGLQSILSALKKCRDCRLGKLGAKPEDFLDISQDREWLWS